MSAPTDRSPRDTSRLPAATTNFFCTLSCAGDFARQPERFTRSL